MVHKVKSLYSQLRDLENTTAVWRYWENSLSVLSPFPRFRAIVSQPKDRLSRPPVTPAHR